MTGPRGLGLLWGGVAVALLGAAPFAPALLGPLPACLFRQAFGVPCPTCGGTRAALALARLDLASAIVWNPLVTLGVIGLVGGGLVAGALALSGRPLQEPARYPLWVRIASVAALAANWGWVILEKR